MHSKLLFRALVGLIFLYGGAATAMPLEITVKALGGDGPVAEATVVLTASDQYQTTDNSGMVSFPGIELPQPLKILAPGYETLLKVVKKTPATLYLTPIRAEIAEVEVVAQRLPEKVSKITLSEDELRHTPGSQGDPLKVIQSLPGVVAANDAGGQVYIRGSDLQDNGVWINRLPVGYLFHMGGLQSVVNPDLVKDFNLFLGGFPAEYDNRLGGFIDVRLREPKNDRLHQNYSLGVYQSSLLLEGPMGESKTDSVVVAGRRSYVDLLLSADAFNNSMNNSDTPEAERNQMVSVPEFYDTQLIWRHQLPHGSVESQFFTAGDRLALLHNSSKKSDPELAGRLSIDFSSKTIGTVWREQWHEKLDQVVAFSYSEVAQDVSVGKDPATGEPFYLKSSTPKYTFQPEFHYNPSPESLFGAGAELVWMRVPIKMNMGIPAGADNPDANFTESTKITIDKTISARTIEPYLKVRQQWWGRLTCDLGLRYALTTASGGVDMRGFSPRAGLEYQANDALLLYGRWGKYLQLPQGYEVLEGFGNPGLDFTEAEHRILGGRYTFLPKWALQGEYYYKPMRKLVVINSSAAPPDTFTNNGTGLAYGVDLMVKRDASDGTMGWLSYSYGHSERTNHESGKEYTFAGDQPHTMTLVWGQPMTGFLHKWRWGIKLQAHTGQPHTPVVDRVGTCANPSGGYGACTDQSNAEADPNFAYWRPVHGEVNSERLPFYYKLDLRLDREWLYQSWKLDFYLDLQNVTFHKNVVDYDYGNSYEKINHRQEVTGLPFIPFFGLEAAF